MQESQGWRDRVHAAFHKPRKRIYRIVQGAVWTLIVVSIMLLIIEGLLPDGHPAQQVLLRVDRVVLTVFALEILLRIGSFRPGTLDVFERPPLGRARVHILSRLRYALRPLVLVDILAVLALLPELRGLRALRLLRLLRTVRIFRYRNPFAIILQTFQENGLLFAFAFSVLGVATLVGGLSLFLVESRVNPQMGSFPDGLWWALVTITTVGYGDVTPVTLLGRLIAGVLMVGGIFTLALFAGIVGSSLVAGMLSIREEQFRMSGYVNHIVVCGYDHSTPLLLNALTQRLDLDQTRVVLFDDHERPRDLGPEFMWVQGDPTKESELDKVRLTHAAAVIVSGERDTSPQVADARTLLITFTIRSYMGRRPEKVRGRHSPLYVVVEILDAENVDHARAAGADEVTETRKIGYAMIAHAVRFHGTAATMSRMLLAGAHNVYIGRIPDHLELPTDYGDLLVKMRLSEEGGLVIGVRTPAGPEFLNPPKSRRIEPGTLLIYLAEEPLLEPPP